MPAPMIARLEATIKLLDADFRSYPCPRCGTDSPRRYGAVLHAIDIGLDGPILVQIQLGVYRSPRCRKKPKFRTHLAFIEPGHRYVNRCREKLVESVVLDQMPIHRAAERREAGPAWVDEDLVFPTDLGTPQRDENLRGRHFLPILLRAGLAKPIERERPAGARGPKPSPRIETVFRVYDLRHTCATLLLAAGENVKVVSERLGHASVQLTLDHYAHVLPGMQARATETLGGIRYKRTASRS